MALDICVSCLHKLVHFHERATLMTTMNKFWQSRDYFLLIEWNILADKSYSKVHIEMTITWVVIQYTIVICVVYFYSINIDDNFI